MDSRTERILRALGNREAFAIVVALLEREMTTSALASVTHLTPATTVAALETLSQAALVDRQPGAQGAWRVAHWPETYALLDRARVLGVAISGTDDRLDREERERFSRLDEAGGATPAAKRGRRAAEEGDHDIQ